MNNQINLLSAKFPEVIKKIDNYNSGPRERKANGNYYPKDFRRKADVNYYPLE